MFFKAVSIFLQFLIDAVGSLLAALVGLLPASPFTVVAANPALSDLIHKINFFIPVYEFVSILQTWLIAVVGFYLYSIYARWVKAIE